MCCPTGPACLAAQNESVVDVMKAFFPRKIDHGSKPPSCSKPGHGSKLIRTHPFFDVLVLCVFETVKCCFDIYMCVCVLNCTVGFGGGMRIGGGLVSNVVNDDTLNLP